MTEITKVIRDKVLVAHWSGKKLSMIARYYDLDVGQVHDIIFSYLEPRKKRYN